MRSRRLIQKSCGVSLVEFTAVTGMVVLFCMALQQVRVAGIFKSKQDLAYEEAEDLVRLRIEEAFNFQENDCPVPGLSETPINHVNLQPGPEEKVLPELQPYYAAVLDFTDLPESFDEKTGAGGSEEMRSLALSGRFVEGADYDIRTSYGDLSLNLSEMKVTPTAAKSIYQISVSISDAKNENTRKKNIQIPIRTVSLGDQTFCWATVHSEPEDCFRQGGFPTDGIGGCQYQARTSLARATCRAMAGADVIENSPGSIRACEKGFVTGSRGGAEAL